MCSVVEGGEVFISMFTMGHLYSYPTDIQLGEQKVYN